jgi:hypothetical protein
MVPLSLHLILSLAGLLLAGRAARWNDRRMTERVVL